MSKHKLRDIVLYCLLVLVFAVSSIDIVHASEDKKGYMDEKAVEIMKNMAEHLSKAKTMSFTATTFFDHVLESGIMIKHSNKSEVFVKRPEKFMALIKKDDQKERKIYFNGKSLVRLMVNENTYQKLDFTGDTDKVLDHLTDNYDVELPLADFLYNDIAATFKEHIISAEYLGKKMVDGNLCHHLSFESTGADWQLWVQAAGKPLPLFFNIKYVHIKEMPEFFAVFKNWQINPELDDKIFTFRPPVGAKEIEIKKAPGSTEVK